MPNLFVKKEKNVENIDYARSGDAGIDLRASGTFILDLDTQKKTVTRDSYVLKPGERIIVETGIRVAIPTGHWGCIRDRSGLAVNHGIHVLGGVIDENYRGEIGVVIINLGKNPYEIKRNERIAQMIILPYAKVNIKLVEDLDETIRNDNGFGSSGKY